MELFNIICGICSIAGLFVSVFTASKAVKITQRLNSDNKDDNSNVVNKSKGSIFHGSYTGRDSINGTGSEKQD